MSLGSVLLRPQVLTAPPPATDDPALDTLFEFGQRLSQEIAAGGVGLTLLEEEVETTLTQLQNHVEPRLATAEPRLTALIDELLGDLGGIFDGQELSLDFDQVVATVDTVLETLENVLTSSSTVQISRVLETLFDLVETDLGLDEAFFRQLLGDLVQRLTLRLEADSGDTDRAALGGALNALREVAGRDLGLPPFSKETLLPPLIERLQAFDFNDRTTGAAGVVSAARRVLSPLAVLQASFPGADQSFGPNTLGAAAVASRGCFYASWLNDEPLGHPDCSDNRDLEQVDFKHCSASALELTALISRLLGTATEATLHGFSIETRDSAGHAANLAIGVGDLLAVLIDRQITASWLRALFVVLSSAAGSLEKINTDFVAWLIPGFGADMGETRIYSRWTWLAREIALSFLTLWNHDPKRYQAFLAQAEKDLVLPGSRVELERLKRIHNHNQIDGFCYLFSELATLLVAIVWPKSEYSTKPGQLAPYFLLSWGTTYLLLLIGACIARLLAGAWPDDAASKIFLRVPLYERIFGSSSGFWSGLAKALLGLAHQALSSLDYLYLLNEGDTNGGTFGGRSGQSFDGYPDPENSPYELPWEQDRQYQCPQGNQGIVSHNQHGTADQTYAFDFAMSHGDEVVAMRPGVVWDYRETIEDNTHERANRVFILHGPPIADYDFELVAAGQVPARTFGVYLHAKKDSISDVFADLGEIGKVTVNAINALPAVAAAFTAAGVDLTLMSGGARLPAFVDPTTGDPLAPIVVAQGQVIMRANNTGKSMFNHVHVDIRPDISAGTATPTRADYTIPFVFRDQDVARDRGIPQALKWYTSDNEKP